MEHKHPVSTLLWCTTLSQSSVPFRPSQKCHSFLIFPPYDLPIHPTEQTGGFPLDCVPGRRLTRCLRRKERQQPESSRRVIRGEYRHFIILLSPPLLLVLQPQLHITRYHHCPRHSHNLATTCTTKCGNLIMLNAARLILPSFSPYMFKSYDFNL